MKRDLSDEEKKFCEKRIKGIEKEKQVLKYDMEIAEMERTRGAKLKYEKQLREYSDFIKKAEGDLKMMDETVKITREMMENGVEVKNKVEVEEDGNDNN